MRLLGLLGVRVGRLGGLPRVGVRLPGGGLAGYGGLVLPRHLSLPVALALALRILPGYWLSRNRLPRNRLSGNGLLSAYGLGLIAGEHAARSLAPGVR